MNQVTIVQPNPDRPVTPASQYLELLHPSGGRIFVAMSDKTKKWVQESADGSNQALAIIKKFEARQPAGVFITQASFDPLALIREAKFAKTVACFCADFDVGIGAEKYALKAEAMAAINKLKKEFPFFVLVDTGGGYHVYWRLQAPISAEEWLPLAQRLKRALQAAGVRADPTVTADLARVLRVPGTINRKTATPRPCKFIELPGEMYSVDAFEAALDRYETLHRKTNKPTLPTTPPAGALPGTKPRAAQGAPVLQLGLSLPPAPTQDEVEKACPAIQALALTGGQTEEVWSIGLINTAAFTADPETAAQSWSASYPGYQPDEVSKKLATKMHAKSAPTSCARMAELDPACAQACTGCAYLGKVSSPIHAGQKLAAARRAISAQLGLTVVTPIDGPLTEPDYGLTETSNAQRMHRALGGSIAWVHELNTWRHFVDGRWHAITPVQMVALAMTVMRDLLAEAATATSAQAARAQATHAAKSLSANSLNSTVALLKSQPGVEIRAAQLDANDMHLGTADGKLIDLTTGQARDQIPADFITKAVGCHYDPAATCPTWLAFLNGLFCGGEGAEDEDDDQGRIGYLHRWVGYALTGQTKEQQFCFAHGTGANGKSVLYGVLQELGGSYCVQSQPEAFMLKQSGEGATPLLARLQGARLVIAPETEDGQRLAESTVKQLTGGDVIVARPIYGHPIEFKPKFKLVIVGNHKPQIRGDDHGIWRRVHLLPFRRIFEPHEQDKSLPEKLRKELPGILNWAIKGCLMWQRAGTLALPEIMQREAREYRSDMDLMAQWLADECEVGAEKQELVSTAYTSFARWCKLNGNAPFSNRRFSQKLTERGFTRTRTKFARSWAGFDCRQSVLGGLLA